MQQVLLLFEVVNPMNFRLKKGGGNLQELPALNSGFNLDFGGFCHDKTCTFTLQQ